MKKFVLLYTGPGWDMENMKQEDMDASMKRWETWMKQVGENMVDAGDPFSMSTKIKSDGSETEPTSMVQGYSIIQAEDFDAAKKVVVTHPHLSEGDDNAIEVRELMHM